MASMPHFLNLTEVEALAKDILPKMVYDYYSGGSETQTTKHENVSAFSKIRLLPRILRNVSMVSTATHLFGMNMSFPVWVAPMAMHGMAHPDRELGTARAAAKAGIPYVLSTMATSSQAELVPTGPNLVFQLYVIRNRDVVKGWVQQAEALGYRALMITVDAPRLGKREADERNRFSLPVGCELKNLEPLRAAQAAAQGGAAAHRAEPAVAADHTEARDNREGSGLMKLFACEIDDSLTWEFIPWVRSITSLPIIVKGVLSPADAKLALQYKVDGLVVSNHGGRQLDYSPTAMEVLPAVVQEVQGRIPVLVDGGIRRGTDVLKALAMGANGVLLGRPALYGLAVGGEAGVSRVLQLLKAEFELAMALAGCASIKDINSSLVMVPPEMKLYSKL